MKKVLVLSGRNEARSQMAERWLKYYGKNHIEVWSAGLEKGNINPLAQKAMSEAVMDIPEYKSKNLAELQGRLFEYILCFEKEVYENLPYFDGNPEVVLVEIPDPSVVEGEEKVRLQAYQAVCNAIEDVCFGFVQERFQIIS